MQNEFEKQVQQKMEELKLVPSEPVWQKVEMQIRQRKDRRRLFLWLPVAVVLIGGGLWYAVYENAETIASKNTRSQTERRQPGNRSQDSERKPIEHNNLPGTLKTENNIPVENTQRLTNKTTPINKFVEPLKTKATPSANRSSEKSNFPEKSSRVKKENAPAEVEKRVAVKDSPGREVAEPAGKTTPDATLLPLQLTDTIAGTKIKEEEIQTIPGDSIATKDSSSIKKPAVKKPAPSKWKYAVVAGSRVAGSGRIGVFNGEKSLLYANPNAPGGSPAASYGPSEVEKGLALTIGGMAKKQLGNRTAFSTGLLYNYYGNTINVGNRIVQNTVLRDYAVSQYYSNIGANNSYVLLQPYDNRYHFLSVPLSFDWQILKKQPLNFRTELSLQYLIHTNGLVFDNNRQAYFHSKDAFNRVQLFAGFGLDYSIPLKKSAIALGPDVQYGLSRLEKGNADYHLFSYGVRAAFQFHKK